MAWVDAEERSLVGNREGKIAGVDSEILKIV
jgi:hypothetical protein